MRCISWNSNGGLLRYGNPDMLFLGTLKNKFHFSRFLTINMQNLMLFFWSGFPFNSKCAKFAKLWYPWKFNSLFFSNFSLKWQYGYLYSWLMVSEQRLLCVGEAHFHLFSSNWLSVEKDENGLRLHKVIFVLRQLIMNTSSHMSF